jgi:hypothetical protein
MVCYLSYAEPSSAYKGRENNSLSLLRIGKHLTLCGAKLRILLAEPSSFVKAF